MIYEPCLKRWVYPRSPWTEGVLISFEPQKPWEALRKRLYLTCDRLFITVFFVMNLIIRSPWSMMVKLAPVGQCILAGPAESQSLPSRNAMHTHQQSYPNICQWSRIFRPWFIDLYIHTWSFMHASMHPCIHTPIHTCIHASMHPCTHAPMHPYLPTYLPTYLRP